MARHQLLDRIDQRIRLAGHNRLALLLFRLGGRQIFGVNVFKVQEVLLRPPLFTMLQLPPGFLGAADIRGRSVPVLDLARAIGQPSDVPANYLVVAEFNRSVQGFLVASVDRIVNIAVEDIQPPPEIGGEAHYLIGVTRYHDELIQLIDVESVLAEAMPIKQGELEVKPPASGIGREVLVVDDSRVARNQIRSVLDQLGLASTQLSDGRQALEHLRQLAASGQRPSERYAMVISDIEMPSMDGYTLTSEIRRDPQLRDLYVLLHTSLSGVFNQSMVEKVGADDFVPKYSQQELAERIVARISQISG
ncbi:chemotaxis protein CheV [Thermomonas hydrothermalis]|uniref:Two-component system, chemotaxis family, response regulator CheV n=1 Tax=Thermomonas hydrothermalis TaxID=213588 RepID=A0A1M5A713_9GAMM|nr:chemotaxis protein CheV [Thermomonas hydrothermalis]SHF26060.1 two-component system, chemotaxis family, response regulator CheV [Thermomonas hydrothermalis]